MTDYFYLHLRDQPDTGVAHGTDDAGRDEWLAAPGPVEGWTNLELTLLSGNLTDYLANDVGVRLCSKLLRDLIDEHRAIQDELQWLEASVANNGGQIHRYFVLHLPSYPDVLHPTRTITARGGFVVKAVLDRTAVEGRTVFSFPGGTETLIVSSELKRAIESAGCTGVDFSRVPVA